MAVDFVSEAIRYIEARVAVYGHGDYRYLKAPEGGEFFEAELPGGYATARIHLDEPNYGKGFIFDRHGRSIGGVPLVDNPRAFASYMNNVDCLIFLGRTAMPQEYLAICDTLLATRTALNGQILQELKDANYSYDGRPWGRFQSATSPWVRSEVIDKILSRAADSKNLAVSAVVTLLNEIPVVPPKWDEDASHSRWNARVDRWLVPYDPIEGVNGDWFEVKSDLGMLAASNDLGGCPGLRAKTKDEQVEVYALRSLNEDWVLPESRVIAAVIVRDGDFDSLLKHQNPEKRFQGSLNQDLINLIEHLEAAKIPEFSM